MSCVCISHTNHTKTLRAFTKKKTKTKKKEWASPFPEEKQKLGRRGESIKENLRIIARADSFCASRFSSLSSKSFSSTTMMKMEYSRWVCDCLEVLRRRRRRSGGEKRLRLERRIQRCAFQQTSPLPPLPRRRMRRRKRKS